MVWQYLAASAAPKVVGWGRGVLDKAGVIDASGGTQKTPEQIAAEQANAQAATEAQRMRELSWTGYGGSQQSSAANQSYLQGLGNQSYDQAQTAASGYNMAASAPQLSENLRAQQQSADSLQAFAQGRESPYQSAAMNMYQRTANEAGNQAMSLAASGRGNNSAAALMQAMALGAQGNAQAYQQASTQAIQERQAAAQQAAQIRSNVASQRMQAGQLQQSILAQGAQQRMQYANMGQQQLASEADSRLQAYNGGQTRRLQQRTADDANRTATTNAGIAAGGSVLASLAGGG